MSVSFETHQSLRRQADVPPACSTYAEMVDAIARRRGSLSRQLERCAAFVLQHPEDVAFETAASLATRLDVSTSTLVRFAGLFGLRGFLDLRLVFRRHICGPGGAIPGKAPARPGTILERIVSANMQTLGRLTAGISPDAWAAAVEILASAGTIYLVAKRQSASVADNVACLFAELGVRCQQTVSLTGSDDDLLRFAGSGDACLAITFSPCPAETVRLVELLAKGRVPIVAMTDTPLSPLAGVTDVLLEVPEPECPGFLPLAGGMVLSSSLGLAVARRRSATNLRGCR